MSEDSPKSHEHICHHCDYLVEIPPLARGEKAYCPRCKTLLRSGSRFSFETSFYLALTSFILLLLSTPFPFLGFNAGGREQIVSLWGSLINIFEQDRPLLAIITFLFIVVIPAIILLCAMALFRSFCGKKCMKNFPWLFKVVYYGGAWAMVEVFVVGILVSLVKISSLAIILYGPSFYIYCLFVITFTLTLGNLDKELLWEAWEEFGNENSNSTARQPA